MVFIEDLKVLIVVLTYRRPDDLEELIPDLTDQVNAESRHVDILVVDNDPDAGAQALVGTFDESIVRYIHEATPGIAAARNRALRASSEHDLLIFIDDDERPTVHWLASMLGTYDDYRPTAVVGPVLSRYDIEPGDWIRAGRFFERRRFRTGTPVSLAATNNLLLDLSQVRELGLEFDARFGISGGSDSVFTRQLHQRGGQMIWCDEAIVIDVVPEERLTRDWVLRRAFRMGNTWTRILLDGTTRWQRLIVGAGLLARGSVRVLGGLTRFAAGVVTGQLGHRARGLRTAARGSGMLTGLVGYVYSEYARK